MKKIAHWGYLPLEPLEKLIDTKVGITLTSRNPIKVAEASQYLQASSSS